MPHTPGPWELVCTRCDEQHGEEYEVQAGDGSIVIACPPSEADARLIAAAPELLAALKRLVEVSDMNCTPCKADINAARAAIRDAEGGAS